MEDPRLLGTLRIRRVEVYPCALPQAADLVSNAAAAINVRAAVYVRIIGADGEEGWGEGRALADPAYTPECSDGLARVIVQHCAAPLLTANNVGAADVRQVLDPPVKGWRMAKAALEQAVLDALLRRAGVSLSSFLGARRDLVPAGAAVGLPKTVDSQGEEAFVDEVAARLAEGYKRVRIKVKRQYQGQEWTRRPLELLRSARVDGVIQPDGNTGYTAADTDLIASLSDLDVDIFEQPLEERPFAAHRLLRGSLRSRHPRVRIGADESVSSYGEFVDAFLGPEPCFDTLVAKWCRNGGISETARTIEACIQHEIPVCMGGMIGLGTHVDLALASLIPDELDTIGDHGPSGKWIHPDADPAPAISWAAPGLVAVPDTAGAVNIDKQRVQQWLRAPAYGVELDPASRPVAQVIATPNLDTLALPTGPSGFSVWP